MTAGTEAISLMLVGSGYMRPEYKSLLLPGIIAISMVFTGIWAVAMPLIAEFQWTPTSAATFCKICWNTARKPSTGWKRSKG